MKNKVMETIETWLKDQAESEIQEVLVDLMVSSMMEPLKNALPSDEEFAIMPPLMRSQVMTAIIKGVKVQVLVSLRSLINANKENTQIQKLIVKKHFPEKDQEMGLEHVENYSEAYAEEVENFYRKINDSDFSSIGMFN